MHLVAMGKQKGKCILLLQAMGETSHSSIPVNTNSFMCLDLEQYPCKHNSPHMTAKYEQRTLLLQTKGICSRAIIARLTG